MKRVIFLLTLCAVILSAYCGVSSASLTATVPVGKTADGRTIFLGELVPNVPMKFVVVSPDSLEAEAKRVFIGGEVFTEGY